MIVSRRSFVASAIGLLAAPAIVRAGSLMPVKAWTNFGSVPIMEYWAGGLRPVDFKFVECGEMIPTHSAVTIRDDGKAYLCRGPRLRPDGTVHCDPVRGLSLPTYGGTPVLPDPATGPLVRVS